MDRLTPIKAAVCTAAAALTAFWGWTGWLAAAWFLAMLLDYATGSAAALRAARPGRVPLFAVFQGSRLTRLTDAQSLLNKLVEAQEET